MHPKRTTTATVSGAFSYSNSGAGLIFRCSTAGFSGALISFLKLEAHVKQHLRHATQMLRRAAPKLLEHFAGPILALIILMPSLQIGPVGDDYRVIDTAHSLSVSNIVKDLHFG